MAGTPALTGSAVLSHATYIQVRKYRGHLIVALDDEAVELDDVTEFIFKRLDGAARVRDIGEAVAAAYEVPVDEATADSIEVLTDLLMGGYVKVADGPLREA
ncbi:PqqD family protein [Streptomyces sp. SAS_269]|uniref:PqqD family protein n=1 Tax=Streptomyces sp. SAS_269 TaxID=3412749 RepID=UPI00403CEC20